MNLKFTLQPLAEIDQLKSTLEQDGIAFFESDFNQDEFIQFSEQFGQLYKHRDSISNGITIVKSSMEESQANSGYFGLTSSSLFPHTDRSTLDNPPNILILYCKNQSGVGGESTLVDFKQVFEQLLKEQQDGSHPILEKDSVIFDDGKTRHKGSIIEKLDDGSYYLRFRNDEFGYFNSKIFPYLNEFESKINANKQLMKLKTGQGYIINNGRFLHGRSSFQGEREMWRTLVNDQFMKQRGFKLIEHESIQANSI